MSEKFKHILRRVLLIGIVVGLIYYFLLPGLVFMIAALFG